jgi:enolase
MTEIVAVHGREILDSRGNPTVEVELATVSGFVGRASVPSGASTGQNEAVELRDKDGERYGGRGVLSAVANVDGELAQVVVGMDVTDQRSLDLAMIEADGTENKGRLGANAILGISLAAAKAAAEAAALPLFRYLGGPGAYTLPVPCANILNGGAHAANNVDFQEFMVVPFGFDEYSEALRAAAEIYAALKKLLVERGHSGGIGDEGGFAPDLEDNGVAIPRPRSSTRVAHTTWKARARRSRAKRWSSTTSGCATATLSSASRMGSLRTTGRGGL